MSPSSKNSTYKQSTSDKHDVDSSRVAFDISKMTIGFVLRKIQDCFKNDFIFKYVSLHFKIADNCNRYPFRERALWVGTPNQSGLQFTKFPRDLVHDGIRN